MKTRKILAVVLSALLLLLPLSVGSFAAAAAPSYTKTHTLSIDFVAGTSFLKGTTSFDKQLSIYAPLTVFDGKAAAEITRFDVYTLAADGVTKVFEDADEDAFYALFDGSAARTLYFDVDVTFQASRLVGDYLLFVEAKDITTTLPDGSTVTQAYNSSLVYGIDTAYSAAVAVPATKLTYTDAEGFDPAGLTLDVIFSGTKKANSNAKTAVVYDETTAKDFTFSYAPGEKLPVGEDRVLVSYQGVPAGELAVTVTHAFGELTSIDSKTHGRVCAGCGEVTDVAEHTVDTWSEVTGADFLHNGTHSGTCTLCNEIVTQEVPETALYLSEFEGMPVLIFIFNLVSTLLNVIRVAQAQ